ncbi:MAG: hypothetical protein HFG59_11025 [Lachnospiraceae bacterium]|nr:hypothetical protein [Lachnospiraceae bacterium]
MKMILTYLGRDDWSRPVYKDSNGRLYVDAAPCAGRLDICTKSGNDFYGEPDMPVKAEATFVPFRDVW